MAGFTLGSIVFWIAIIAVVLVYGGQVGLAYVEKQTIRGAVTAALLDSQSKDMTAQQLRSNIQNRMTTNTIDFSSEELTVNKEGKGFEVTVEREKNIKITEEIKIVVDQGFTEISE